VCEHCAKPETNGKQQHEKSNADAEHVRNRSDDAEIHPRRQQHEIVRPGRDRGDEGIDQQRQERFKRHDFLPNRSALLSFFVERAKASREHQPGQTIRT
jgi:hypothetical protein